MSQSIRYFRDLFVGPWHQRRNLLSFKWLECYKSFCRSTRAAAFPLRKSLLCSWSPTHQEERRTHWEHSPQSTSGTPRVFPLTGRYWKCQEDGFTEGMKVSVPLNSTKLSGILWYSINWLCSHLVTVKRCRHPVKSGFPSPGFRSVPRRLHWDAVQTLARQRAGVGTWDKRLESPKKKLLAIRTWDHFPINGGFSMPGGERHSLFAQRGALRREHRRGLQW